MGVVQYSLSQNALGVRLREACADLARGGLPEIAFVGRVLISL